MSKTNKAKDRDANGRLKSKYKAQHSWTFNTPKWWLKIYMNRPRRALNRRLCHSILTGRDYDGIAFPLGNNKPHEYFY